MKRALPLVLVLLAVGVAVPAHAQSIQIAVSGDSTLDLVNGDSGAVYLSLYNQTNGVSAYSITLKFDTSRVELLHGDAYASMPAPSITPGVNEATIATSGTGTSSPYGTFALLWFRMRPGAVQGTLISMKVNSLTNYYGGDGLPSHSTAINEICHAATYWGDLTGEHVINSRDALVALTKAVGGSTASFDTSPGDVDGDGFVTSRDALIILSHTIQSDLDVDYDRTGVAKADRCAPLAAAPDSVLFFRESDLYRISAHDTVAHHVPLPVPHNAFYPAVWSPDGSAILFTGATGANAEEIMVYHPAGGTVDTLASSPYHDVGADWSPDGSLIAFVSDRAYPNGIWTVTPAGGSLTLITSSAVSADGDQRVAWSPDGSRLAFVGDSTGCCSFGIWMVDADGQNLTEILPGNGSIQPRDVLWSTGGDSVLYRSDVTQAIYSVPADPAPQVSTRLFWMFQESDPGVSSGGYVFRTSIYGRREVLLQRPADGNLARMFRYDGDDRTNFSFRRSP